MSTHEQKRLGQQIGHYRLIRRLGKGGFAEVYLGEHVYLKTHNAIKLLHVQLSAKTQQDFINEARIIARLEHPHIVHVLDFGIEGETPFLVMSYAPNGSLRQRYPHGTLVPLEQVIDLVLQAAAALDYAHQFRLIHRDIKPENMLIGQQNQLMISDFGLALTVRNSSSQAAAGMGGTVSYMAPEQLQGRVRFASDQYALGIVVYEWLCGELPFSGSFAEIAGQHVLTPPASLRERLPDLPPALEQVVFKALQKDPHQRFASSTEFALALRLAQQPHTHTDLPSPTLHTPASPPEAGSNQPESAAGSVTQVRMRPQSRLPAPEMSESAARTHKLSAGNTAIPSQMPPVLSASGGRRKVPRPRAAFLALLALALIGAGLSAWFGSASLRGGHGSLVHIPTAQSQPASSSMTANHGTTDTAITPSATSARKSGSGRAAPSTAAAATNAPTRTSPATASPATPTQNPPTDCLQGSPSHLDFTSLLGLGNPGPRDITITTCGGAGSWVSAVSGSGWLSASPSAGSLAAHNNETVVIAVSSSGLQLRTYQGAVSFTRGTATWTLTVTYTIVQT
jgi:serine/threonine protein kinase